VERRSPLLQLSREQVDAALRSVLPEARLVSHAVATSGRSNTNYFLDTDCGRFVLRVHVRDAALGPKEQALSRLVHGRVPVAEVLGTRPGGEALEQAFSLLRFVPGETLEELLRSGAEQRMRNAARSLGRALAQIGLCRFENAGDLVARAGDGALSVEPWPFSDFERSALFDSPAAARLGPLRDELWPLLEQARARFPDSSPIQLVHADFNPTNLLFDQQGELSAVLDWEFAHAGQRWMDLGNLLRERPASPLPDAFVTELVSSLRDHAVELPSYWRELTLLTDLGSALEFLSSPDDRPQTHAAALAQIETTIAFLKA
jgi:aminoglycoside phosphotransferase (APT) family kinase protein